LGFPTPARADTLTVFAASSLTESFTEIGRAYEKVDSGVTVRFNFAGSQQLAAQIEQGAVADVFASADGRWLDYVAHLGKTAGDQRVFAQNRLVVIVPKKNPAHIERLRDLINPGVKVVLGAQSTPVGRYTRTSLTLLTRQPGFPPDFKLRLRDNLVSEEENVKAVVAKVQLGEADAGFVFRTDVTPKVAKKVLVFELPEIANPPGSYPIAMLAAAPQPVTAQAFIAFVLGEEGQAILRRHAFLPPPPIKSGPPQPAAAAPPDSASRR
jgi:molybdate transport system substrate-binding protein